MADRPEGVMANPLVEAVQHFPLPQLMADPNRCRNVLNDIGADPAEVFLLVAALETRVPQTLMEHQATDELSMIQPRLVSELNQRGVERSRAEWAVNAWKDVISGSRLGQKTVIRQTEPATERAGGAATERAAGPVTQPAAGPVTQPAAAAATQPAAAAATQPAARPTPPITQHPTVPQRPGPRRRRGLLVGAVIAALVIVAGVAVWLAWPNDKHKSSGSSSTPPAANLSAQLGPPTSVSVPAATPWTNTNLKVTKGERIYVSARGTIVYGPNLTCDPDGAVRPSPDPGSIIGGRHAAVIGLIGGSGLPFYVGSSYNGVAPASGQLYLGINDLGVTDNSGQFSATVRLQR
jgi:hypothetical protein